MFTGTISDGAGSLCISAGLQAASQVCREDLKDQRAELYAEMQPGYAGDYIWKEERSC
ncbi:hypothetical protein GCM10010911_05710 [Paenibacillus nasutitermitis]|uniref:Uncharacterized protein n=1 Tax=Paenibacillus nasutitermitis TaxID=1652958 RepID=A0A917DN76_9BACL|nr:hypothetical protein GCM10010911_05710 [Paenibacillus nasutitermitis]